MPNEEPSPMPFVYEAEEKAAAGLAALSVLTAEDST